VTLVYWTSQLSDIDPNVGQTDGKLVLTVGSGVGVALQVNTSASPPVELDRPSYTLPLAGVYIENLITVRLKQALETSMNANATWRVTLYRCATDGSLISTLGSSEGAELSTSAATLTLFISVTPTTLADGDRILARCFAISAGGAMASGYQVRFRAGGDATNEADSHIEFFETITEYSGAPTPPNPNANILSTQAA
jgi:hypothetical protein